MSIENKKIPATVRVLTFKSEKVLRKCLESVKDFAEILVLDANSSDRTLEIAREYGARIEKQFPDSNEPNMPITDWPAMVTRALKLATYDWVFYIDHDEAIPPATAEEIRAIVSNSDIPYHVYRIPNRIMYFGREIKYATPYPGYQPRLVNKTTGAYYGGGPHYRLFYDRNKYKMGTMKNPWYVFIDEEEHLKKRFMILESLDAKGQSWRQFLYWSVWRKLGTATNIFIKMVIMYARHGFKDTLPPRVEFLRVKNKLIIFWYCVRIRLFKQDITKEMPQENR